MLCFLLLKTQSLSASGRMEGEKEMGGCKKAVEVKRNGKIWRKKEKQRILKTFEGTKWFYLQI